MTTFLSRVEPAAAPLLGLPPHHALAATIFLGVPGAPADAAAPGRRSSSFTTVDRFDGEPFST